MAGSTPAYLTGLDLPYEDEWQVQQIARAYEGIRLYIKNPCDAGGNASVMRSYQKPMEYSGGGGSVRKYQGYTSTQFKDISYSSLGLEPIQPTPQITTSYSNLRACTS